jgi:hypothetical protein
MDVVEHPEPLNAQFPIREFVFTQPFSVLGFGGRFMAQLFIDGIKNDPLFELPEPTNMVYGGLRKVDLERHGDSEMRLTPEKTLRGQIRPGLRIPKVTCLKEAK